MKSLTKFKLQLHKNQVAILTSVHTRFIAELLKKRFEFHGISSKVFHSYGQDILANFFVVLSPQIFSQLPKACKRVFFQMEQSTSTRWFTDRYLEDMRNSRGVLDYSIENIKKLKELGIESNKIHYLPIGANSNFTFQPSALKEYDFVFYGDYYSSNRRQNFIKALQQKYSVLILQDVFEEELYRAISSAKAVINLHYYENPLLETTRICECLSIGMSVLSEATSDSHYYPEFNSAVTYFKEDSLDDLMMKAQWFLDHLPSQASIRDAAIQSEMTFNTHFDKAFFALGLLPIKSPLQRITNWLKTLHR